MIEDWIVLNMTPAQIAAKLEDMADELIDSIDGGEECRGRDTRLSHQAALLKRAAEMIQVSNWLDELDERLRNLKQGPYASQQPGNF